MALMRRLWDALTRVLPPSDDVRYPGTVKCPCGARHDAFVRCPNDDLTGWRRPGQ